MRKELENQIEEAIKKEIEAVVKLAQNRYECDLFGFGEIVHRKYPHYWKQVKNNWNEEFCNMSVDIEVVSKIRRTGLFKDSIKPE